MATIEQFEDLDAWKLAREVTNKIYRLSSNGTFAKDLALVNQMRRASISILSNIAEGFERNGDKEFVQFLTVAKGSCGEARAQLYLALDQGYIEDKDFVETKDGLVQISKMIAGLIGYLKRSELKGSKFR